MRNLSIELFAPEFKNLQESLSPQKNSRRLFLRFECFSGEFQILNEKKRKKIHFKRSFKHRNFFIPVLYDLPSDHVPEGY